ncbi:endolytic transglycosylase MltG, partial [Streptococcus pyogenes]
IQPGQSLGEVFATLREGQQYQDAITFIEGSTFAQWRLQMASAPHLEQTLTALDEADISKRLGAEYTKLEGLLLPETYAYDVG